MIDRQMELTLDRTRLRHATVRRQRRLERARWWFDRMRAAVDGARDRMPRPRPEQMVLGGTYRQPAFPGTVSRNDSFSEILVQRA